MGKAHQKNFNFRTCQMKIKIFDEFGKLVYDKEGAVLDTLKDCLLSCKFHLQLININDLLKFNFMGTRLVNEPKLSLLDQLMKEINGEDNNGATEGLSSAQRLKQDKVV